MAAQIDISIDEDRGVRSVLQLMASRLKRCLAYACATVDPRTGLEQFCPSKPWPKQQIFLDLECEEAFYGGAAGGGKSEVLLMAALQYVHVPGYSALILRRDFARLSLAGAIMDRAKQWLAGTGAVWNDQRKTFRFPSGATLQFGYIDSLDDRFRYMGTEYQFIGWDELTEFKLPEDEGNPYTYMFRSLRATTNINVPKRVRATSNPGNIGHVWTKKRFISDEALAALRRGEDRIFDGPDGRKFVASRISDNPALDEADYREKLRHLPTVTRARLMEGNWDVAESLVIPSSWFRRFSTQGDMLVVLDANGTRTPNIVDARTCRRFATVDTAGTSRDKAEESRGKPASWSVIAIWDYWPTKKLLFLRHVWRERAAWTELKVRSADVLHSWNVSRVNIENAHVGQPLAAELRGAGFDARLVGPTLPGMIDGWRGAKLERAISAGLLSMLEDGRLLTPDAKQLPATAAWLSAFELELTSWTGSPDETSDQIDASSYGAWEVKNNSAAWGGTL